MQPLRKNPNNQSSARLRKNPQHLQLLTEPIHAKAAGRQQGKTQPNLEMGRGTSLKGPGRIRWNRSEMIRISVHWLLHWLKGKLYRKPVLFFAMVFWPWNMIVGVQKLDWMDQITKTYASNMLSRYKNLQINLINWVRIARNDKNWNWISRKCLRVWMRSKG